MNVLGFLDGVAGATNEIFKLVGSPMQKEAAEARAAVAELVEASREFMGASFFPDFDGCPKEVQQEYSYRHKMLSAALASMERQP